MSRIVGLILFACTSLGLPEALPPSVAADRAAVERIYYNHRLGTKPPFEEAVSASSIKKLVRAEAKKEAVLADVYGVEIKESEIADEVKRIDATTRAPEMLAEIKAALGHDPARFARAVARPIVVERTLRGRFENDDKLHAAQRRQAEQARARLLAKKPVKELRDVTWQLARRPPNEQLEAAQPPPETKGVAKSGAYSIEATAQVSQVIASPGRATAEKETLYIEDLAPELQQVLRAQLRTPGDVTAVIETPAAFLVFVAKEVTDERLSTKSLSIPKRSYDTWLAEQPEKT